MVCCCQLGAMRRDSVGHMRRDSVDHMQHDALGAEHLGLRIQRSLLSPRGCLWWHWAKSRRLVGNPPWNHCPSGLYRNRQFCVGAACCFGCRAPWFEDPKITLVPEGLSVVALGQVAAPRGEAALESLPVGVVPQ